MAHFKKDKSLQCHFAGCTIPAFESFNYCKQHQRLKDFQNSLLRKINDFQKQIYGVSFLETEKKHILDRQKEIQPVKIEIQKIPQQELDKENTILQELKNSIINKIANEKKRYFSDLRNLKKNQDKESKNFKRQKETLYLKYLKIQVETLQQHLENFYKITKDFKDAESVRKLYVHMKSRISKYKKFLNE
jgi:hypothetical protein